ncbi:MAG: M1 family aminopeptidase [bacterium]
MRKIWLLPLLFMLSSLKSLPAEETYWQQFVHYTMDITLMPTEKALTGKEIIIYRNNSPDTLYQFYLHLYPNGYQSSKSIRAEEAKRFYQKINLKPQEAGYLKIESFRILTKNSDREKQTLTAFKVNDTILEADLPNPLSPGEELQVELSFYLKVRKFRGRAGYRGNQYDFAQWYPKVCVYDDTGWNAEPFHYLGEFYGEFGTFDVTVNVPFEYIVGATGEVIAGDPGWKLVKVDTSLSEAEWQETLKKMRAAIREQSEDGKMRMVKFHAENVHDFAWITCPDFLYEKGEWDGIPIHVLYRSYAKNRWSQKAAERGARALEWLSTKFGRYPYPQLSITHGLLGGGMEYPMLVMNRSESEGLILHEVGHIYFYGILANNEWKEAWLDEGFTSFQTRWYMETRYGKWGYDRAQSLKKANWLQKHRPGRTSRQGSRDFVVNYINSSHNEPISKASYQFDEPLAYSINAYTKGAFFYDMLKYVVGDETFDKICHQYFDRWALKHVNEARFKQVCEEVSGQDLSWFFNQWLHDSLSIEYALGKVKKNKIGEVWHTEVEIKRKQKGIMPVDVQLTTQDGDTLVQRWDGFEENGSLTFQTKSKPKKVILDPQDAILDKSRLNNGPLKFEFLFEYPNMFYTPRDAYLITWRPGFWYNEVDKVRIGGRLRGRYGNSRNVYLGAWFGVDSQELDARIRYSNPITPLGKGTRGTFSAQKMEGRFEIDAHLNFVKGKYLTLPPQHKFWVGFNHSRLIERKGALYTRREFDQKNDLTIADWDSGKVNNVYFRYVFNPRGLFWYSNLAFGLDLVHDDWGSDFDYNSVYSELKIWLPKNREGIFLRFYGHKIFNSDEAPIQELIYLDGANPRLRFQRFYLRSDGALPEELHYHLPGGGNLRGFYNQPIIGEQILALNIELRKSFRPEFLGKKLRSILGTTALAAFVDLADMQFQDKTSKFFMDAGFGVRLQKFLPDNWYTIFTGGRNLTLRLDFPLWVNEPLPDENSLRFRWVFGFEQAF